MVTKAKDGAETPWGLRLRAAMDASIRERASLRAARTRVLRGLNAPALLLGEATLLDTSIFQTKWVTMLASVGGVPEAHLPAVVAHAQRVGSVGRVSNFRYELSYVAVITDVLVRRWGLRLWEQHRARLGEHPELHAFTDRWRTLPEVRDEATFFEALNVVLGALSYLPPPAQWYGEARGVELLTRHALISVAAWMKHVSDVWEAEWEPKGLLSRTPIMFGALELVYLMAARFDPATHHEAVQTLELLFGVPDRFLQEQRVLEARLRLLEGAPGPAN